jgi:hypothetical protein
MSHDTHLVKTRLSSAASSFAKIARNFDGRLSILYSGGIF